MSQELAHPLGLVGGEVVEDDMDSVLLEMGGGGDQGAAEGDELLIGVAEGGLSALPRS
jgi:hypothetical protein